MKRQSLILLLVLAAAFNCLAQTPGTHASSTPAQIQKRVEAYLRKLYAWGPSFRVKVGTLSDAPVPGFYEVTIEVTKDAQADTGVVYVSKDGRYLLRGELNDISSDPFASSRSRIRLDGNPSKGPSNARVIVVEYSDFQCPHCRQLHEIIRAIQPNYPQVRFVFKDFPLPQIHPWAMTAAIAGRCAFSQDPQAFWKLHHLIFDNQDSITPENAWNKFLDFASQAGLELQEFRTCMASPEAKEAVAANVAEAQALKIANTPTVFVNGRRLVGGDRSLLEQYLNYEFTVSGEKPSP